jgi:hypothetical protein
MLKKANKILFYLRRDRVTKTRRFNKLEGLIEGRNEMTVSVFKEDGKIYYRK